MSLSFYLFVDAIVLMVTVKCTLVPMLTSRLGVTAYSMKKLYLSS